jgi:hypothetical protein
MNRRRYAFLGGVLVAGAGVAALLLGLPGVRADGGPPLVAVHAVDYAYQGVPHALAAGEVRFSFTDDSKSEPHQMQLYRINDGVNESLDQILAEDEARQNQNQPGGQPGGQGGQSGGQGGQPSGRAGDQNPPADQSPPPPPKMTLYAGTGAGPGNAARMDLIGKLPAGRYAMVCFLPVSGDDAGTPHYKKGMKAEFTVR